MADDRISRTGEPELLRVLVVDDSADDRALIVRELQRSLSSCEVKPMASDGDLDGALAETAFDAVVTDYRLRSGSGLTVLRRVKERWPGCAVVIFAAAGSAEIGVEAIRAGADDYVVKDRTNAARLPAAVAAAVERAREKLADGDLPLGARADGRESEERLRAVFEKTHVGIVITDLEGRIVDANRAYEAMLGYSVEELRGRSFAEFTHPDDVAENLRRFGEARAARDDLRIEKRYVRRDGGVVWVDISAILVRDAGEDAAFRFAVAVDITERVRAEQALRASNERFELVARATKDGLWDWDLETGTGWLDETLRAMFGLAVGEVPSLEELAARIHPDDRDRVVEGVSAAIRGAGESWSDTFRCLLADGAYGYVLDRGFIARAPDGKPARMIGAITDVTELRRIEEALDESRERFRAIFEEAHVGMCILDQQGLYVATNAAYQTMLGYTADELRGRSFVAFTHPEDRPPDAAAWSASFEQGAFRVEKRYLRKDGSVVWVDLSSSLIPSPGGEWFAFAIAADVTGRKRLEEQLLQSQKLEAIGRLAGGIAHDFNNLLTAITGYGEIVLNRLAEDDPLRGDVEQITRAGERAATLTQQLLAFARRQVMRPTLLDANEVVVGIESMLRRLIGEDVEIVLELASAPGLIVADLGQLEQVIVNLAVNSRDAMPDGGLLTIATGSAELGAGEAAELGVPAGAYVTLRVSDDGVGMDESARERAFEPFFTTKEIGRGTGLGLSTVLGIVEQSGGHVGVESEPGHGATFTIHLPRAQPPPDREG